MQKRLAQTHAASRKQVATHFVQELVQSLSDSEQLPETECRFLDAGLDSLLIVEMSGQIQVELGDLREVPATLVFDYPRVCDLAAFLVSTFYPEKAVESTPDPPPIAPPYRPGR